MMTAKRLSESSEKLRKIAEIGEKPTNGEKPRSVSRNANEKPSKYWGFSRFIWDLRSRVRLRATSPHFTIFIEGTSLVAGSMRSSPQVQLRNGSSSTSELRTQPRVVRGLNGHSVIESPVVTLENPPDSATTQSESGAAIV